MKQSSAHRSSARHRLKQQIDRHRAIANACSKLRNECAAWRSLWSFLTNLNDLDFYRGLDEQRDICIALSALRQGARRAA